MKLTKALRFPVLGLIWYCGTPLPVSAATYSLGLNEKYEQFSDLMPLLRDDDTVLVTTDISSYCTVNGLRLTILGKTGPAKLVWGPGFENPVFKGTLMCNKKARVTVENLDIRGLKGSAGYSYCPIFSCQMGEQGGRGESPVSADGSTVILKHCVLRGGAGGSGGVFGSRGCAVCGCSPCGTPAQYAPDGAVGHGISLTSSAVAETLDVKVQSIGLGNGGKVIACCSAVPVGLANAVSRPPLPPFYLMSFENADRDIRGRKQKHADAGR